MKGLRYRIILKLIKFLIGKKVDDVESQALSIAVWHWVTPFIEHAGYEWTWKRIDTVAMTAHDIHGSTGELPDGSILKGYEN